MPRTAVIGDSLGVGTVPYLRRLLGRVDADVRVGRGSAEGVRALRRMLGRKRYGRVVLDLGTNDWTAGQLARSIRRAKRAAGDTPLFVATVRGREAAAKNRVLARAGVGVIDWAGRSGGLVAGDGVHATPGGYRRRARLVARTLRDAEGPVARTRQPRSRRRAPVAQVALPDAQPYATAPLVAPEASASLAELLRRRRF